MARACPSGKPTGQGQNIPLRPVPLPSLVRSLHHTGPHKGPHKGPHILPAVMDVQSEISTAHAHTHQRHGPQCRALHPLIDAQPPFHNLRTREPTEHTFVKTSHQNAQELVSGHRRLRIVACQRPVAAHTRQAGSRAPTASQPPPQKSPCSLHLAPPTTPGVPAIWRAYLV